MRPGPDAIRDILEIHYGDYKQEIIDSVLKKYHGRYAVAKLDVSTYEVQQRIKSNKGKCYRDQIKPANFITVGVGFQENPETGKKVIPMLPYIDKNSPEFDCIPYMPFRDYKTGREYLDEELKDGQLWTKSYWKPMSRVVRDYINHKESKSEGDIGQLKRRIIRIGPGSIRHIGKETNEIVEAEVIGVESEYYTEYINWKGIIECLTPDQAAMIGISRRNLSYLKRRVKLGEPFSLKQSTKNKLRKKHGWRA